jgi:hypothetical protein
MKTLLRLEHAALALAALIAYQLSGGSWWLFAALILVPDLSMAGYLRGPSWARGATTPHTAGLRRWGSGSWRLPAAGRF